MSSRTVSDPQGRTWLVWSVYPSSTTQVAPAGVHPDYRDGWLTFECGSLKRRLAPIPPGWEAASDNAVLGMLARATEARRSASSLDTTASPG